MASLTVRITDSTHRILSELAQRSGDSMQSILDKALEDYRRNHYLTVEEFARGVPAVSPSTY